MEYKAIKRYNKKNIKYNKNNIMYNNNLYYFYFINNLVYFIYLIYHPVKIGFFFFYIYNFFYSNKTLNMF